MAHRARHPPVDIWVVRGANGALDATLQLQDADPDIWGADDGRALYLHRLTVARRCSGSGLGGRLLEWALGESGARGRARLRELRLTRFERAVPPSS